jgi:D-3-phosphoglycerate dehydrogenase
MTLGENGINIARMTVGQEAEHGRNIILLNTDELISKDVLQKVKALPQIDDAMVLELPL